MVEAMASGPLASRVSSGCVNAVQHLLRNCGGLESHEKLLIIYDSTTASMADLMLEQARLISSASRSIEVPVARVHGQEPTAEAARAMLESDLIMAMSQFSLAHTSARIEAGKKGARFLSLPCYSWDLLNSPAITVDYQQQLPAVRAVSDSFTAGSKARITTDAGTEVFLDIRDRIGNCCPGFVQNPGDLGSPPDIEANVSPVETFSHGKIVVDGSITAAELGLLETPVIIFVEDGRITKFESQSQRYLEILENMFGEPNSKRRVLAECGVGLNPKAELTGAMLTDEGAMGCMHFGFGSNYTVGGQNKVDFHMDFVFRAATLEVDGVVVIENGELKL